MVSFSCEVCNDTVQKKKLDQHKQRCYGAYYTCIDCSVTFQGNDYAKHTSCISEAEKYEKGLYKGKKHNAKPVQPVKKIEIKTTEIEVEPIKEDKKDDKKDKKSSKDKKSKKEQKQKSFDSYISSNDNLYKVLKNYSKDSKIDKKDLLKKLTLSKNENGEVIIKL